MFVENKIGSKFNSISQRLVYPYIATYPKFTPINSDEISLEAQKQIYDFLYGAIYKIYNNPEIIGLPLNEDDYFNGEAYKDKPELYETMKKIDKSFLSFFNLLFQIGFHSDVSENRLFVPKVKKSLANNKLELLKNFGLKYEKASDGVFIYSDEFPKMHLGLKYLSMACYNVERKDITKAVIGQGRTRLMFMKCILDINSISFDKIYGSLEQSGTYLNEIERFLLDKGFKYILKDASFYLQKDYLNKQEAFFEVIFGSKNLNQLTFNVDVPSLKIIMEHFDELDDDIKEAIFSRTKNCNLCGYCTATGKKVVVAVPVKNNGAIVNKCPYYPYFKWTTLNEKTTTIIKNLYDCADKILL